MSGQELICSFGHAYRRKSNCVICPICERIRKQEVAYFCSVSAPARRALESVGIYSLEDLEKWSLAELSKLHGIGPKALQLLIEIKKH